MLAFGGKKLDNKTLKTKKPPGFLYEAAFVSVNLLFLKFYSEKCFQALSFMAVLVPIMLYQLLSLIGHILQFVQSMHMEDYDSEEESILSPLQISLLFQVAKNMLGYFGLYTVATKLDTNLQGKDLATANWIPAIVAVNLAFLIQLIANYQKRAAIQKATNVEGANVGFLGATGLTTIFNALTQTTTTLCANGQCFTIYSNTISSQLAAFGVSVTGINTYLIPLCCCLLTYSLWTLYRNKRSCVYKPFLMGLVGSVLIVCDNFIFGDKLQLHNIPSWIGNGLLIGAAIWSSRDTAKENSSPFGF